jgi:hypothetical protein
VCQSSLFTRRLLTLDSSFKGSAGTLLVVPAALRGSGNTGQRWRWDTCANLKIKPIALVRARLRPQSATRAEVAQQRARLKFKADNRAVHQVSGEFLALKRERHCFGVSAKITINHAANRFAFGVAIHFVKVFKHRDSLSGWPCRFRSARPADGFARLAGSGAQKVVKQPSVRLCD